MNILLKFLLTTAFFVSTNCSDEYPPKINDNVNIVAKPNKVTDPIQTIDTIIHLNYTWKDEIDPKQTLKNRIKTPYNFKRIDVERGSFADWLRHLPMQPQNSKIHLFNGELKSNQGVHEAVVDIDVGKRDLQQCADATMRLRSEYFYGKADYSKIHFNYTSGDRVRFDDWMKGKKPVINGNSVRFSNKTNSVDHSYSNFRKYLVSIFSYAGTASLSKEMEKVAVENMEIGDVFIQGGFPGHAIIVVDMIINKAGEKYFLLAQSYMPAQEIHILKNFNDDSLNPWYPVGFSGNLYTPEWTFLKTDLKRW